MLKKTLIAAAAAVALAGGAGSMAAPAAAAPASTIDIAWKGGWNGDSQWDHHDRRKTWNRQRACQPIIRWKPVGYRYHRRWQPVVVGWNCGSWGHEHHNGWNWKWH